MLSNKIIDQECTKRRDKYSLMTAESASIFFSFEFQGYIAAMIKAHGLTMMEVFVKILELMELFENAQKGKTQHEQNHDQ